MIDPLNSIIIMKFFALLVFALTVLQGVYTSALVGGYSEPSLGLLSDPHVLEIHNYMLEQHPELADSEIVSVSTQVVAGTNYKIHYKTAAGVEYEAVIFDQPWTHHRSVTSFHELGNITE